MKKILLLIVLCVTSGVVMAQDATLNNRHELKAGIGGGWFYKFGSKVDGTSFRNESKDTPSYNLSYHYRLSNLIAIGGTLTYANGSGKNYIMDTQTLHSAITTSMMGVTPSVRFDWMQKKIIRLYSSAGVGVGYVMKRETDATTNNNSNEKSVVPLIDLIFIGVSAGKKLFGFGELGLSSSGIVRLGVGYRFGEK